MNADQRSTLAAACQKIREIISLSPANTWEKENLDNAVLELYNSIMREYYKDEVKKQQEEAVKEIS